MTSTIDLRRLRDWDNEHVWHPFTPMQAYRREEAPIIVAADGFHLIDVEGKRYLDGISSMWCNVHGHRVPEIDQAIREQLDRVAHSTLLGLASVPSIELAHRLCELAPPGLMKVFFSDSGASAVEVALKLAYQFYRQRPGKPERRDTFVCLGDAYHGDTLGAASVGGVARFHQMFEPLLFPTLKVPPPSSYRVPPGFDGASYLAHCEEAMHQTIRDNADRIAAVIVEPLVQCAAGILVHPPGYLSRVREWTREHDILLIADEVAVGFGRTGTLFASEQEEVAPDLLCLGKGLTGGYLPVAATLATDEIHAAFLGEPIEGKTFFHGHTYTGNALGCAAALASLELIESNQLVERVRRNSRVLSDRLAEWSAWPHVGDVRQKGYIVGIELVRDKETKEPFPPAERRGHQVAKAALRRGVLNRPLGDVVTLFPPLALPTGQLHGLCDAVGEAVLEVTALP